MKEDRLYTLEYVLKGESRYYDHVSPDHYCFLTLIKDAYTAFSIQSSFCKYRLDSAMTISCDEEVVWMFECYANHDVIRIHIEPDERGRAISMVSPKGRLLVEHGIPVESTSVVRALCWKEEWHGVGVEEPQVRDNVPEVGVQEVPEVGEEESEAGVQEPEVGDNVPEVGEEEVHVVGEEEVHEFGEEELDVGVEDFEVELPDWVPDLPEDVSEEESDIGMEDFEVELPDWVPDLPEDVSEEESDIGMEDFEVDVSGEEPEEGNKVPENNGESSDFDEVDVNHMRIRDSSDSEKDEIQVDRGVTRRARKILKMDPVSDYGGKEFHVGEDNEIKFKVRQWFRNSVVFRNAVKDYAIKGGYKLRFIKNDSTRVTVACSNNCPWRIHASVLSGQQKFMVKTLTDIHTCMAVMTGHWVTPKWIARQIEHLLRANPNLDNNTLKAALKKFGVNPKNWKLYKAKAMYKLNSYGTHVESYAKLHVYCDLLKALNPGSVVVLQGQPQAQTTDPLKFGRVFVCLNGVKEGFIRGCRPFLGVDGCHLKGPFGGTLLAAVSLDANNAIVPVAWAIVDKENGSNWEWFIHLLYAAVGTHASGKALTIMSDGQKGLGDQIEVTFPNARHRRCAKHISANFFQSYRGIDLEHYFWEMVYATTRIDFNRTMALLKRENIPARKIGADMLTPAKWLERLPLEKWSVHAFDEYVKCLDVTNNLVESFNSWILKIRGLPIVDLLDKLRQKMMSRQHKRYVEASKCETRVVPKVMEQLRRLSSNCRGCKIIPARNHQYEVVNEGRKFVVDLMGRTCSCCVWQLSGVPCIHVVAAVCSEEGDLQDLVDDYFKVDKWMKTYEYSINPFPDADLEPTEPYFDKYHPPDLTRRAGRPKKHNRRREDGECQPTLRSNSVKCGICGLIGHNKRSCQGAPTNAKGKRKRHNAKIAIPSHSQGPRNRKGATTSNVDMESCAEGEPSSSSTVAKLQPRRGKARSAKRGRVGG